MRDIEVPLQLIATGALLWLLYMWWQVMKVIMWMLVKRRKRQ